MTCLILILLVIIPGESHAQDQTIPTFILVRYAEKDTSAAMMQRRVMNEDPELSEKGTARALRLAAMLQRQPISAIYSTNYKRISNTVKPLADAFAQSVQFYEAFK
jgi:broad specificity phosphatase PhoE